MSSLNWVDIAVVVVVGLSVVIGLFRGFIKEALSLANWILAIYGGVLFHDKVGGYLLTTIQSDMLRSMVAFGIVFLGILLAGSAISYLLSILVKKSGLGGTDKLLGIFFGFARGVLLSAIVLAVLGLSPFKQHPQWQQSKLVPQFQPVMAWLHAFVPEKVNVAKKMLETPEPATTSQVVNIALLKPVNTASQVLEAFDEDEE